MKTTIKIKREYVFTHMCDMFSLKEEVRAQQIQYIEICERHGLKTAAIVLWWHEEEEETIAIHETVYGELSEAEDVVFLEENHIRQIIRENHPRIIEAREEFAGTDGKFLERLLKMFYCHREEILGGVEMMAGRQPSWFGEPPAGIWWKVLIPNERISVPFRISTKVTEGCFVPLIDLDHPDADLMSAWEWHGSASHGRDVRVVWSISTGRGFDLSRSKWPKKIPVNYMTLRRVVDERGKSPDCRGDYPEVYSIDRIFN